MQVCAFLAFTDNTKVHMLKTDVWKDYGNVENYCH